MIAAAPVAVTTAVSGAPGMVNGNSRGAATRTRTDPGRLVRPYPQRPGGQEMDLSGRYMTISGTKMKSRSSASAATTNQMTPRYTSLSVMR